MSLPRPPNDLQLSRIGTWRSTLGSQSNMRLRIHRQFDVCHAFKVLSARVRSHAGIAGIWYAAPSVCDNMNQFRRNTNRLNVISVSTPVPSTPCSVTVRLHVTGIHSSIAFSPRFTCRPSSFQRLNEAIGPRAMPRRSACINARI